MRNHRWQLIRLKASLPSAFPHKDRPRGVVKSTRPQVVKLQEKDVLSDLRVFKADPARIPRFGIGLYPLDPKRAKLLILHTEQILKWINRKRFDLETSHSAKVPNRSKVVLAVFGRGK